MGEAGIATSASGTAASAQRGSAATLAPLSLSQDDAWLGLIARVYGYSSVVLTTHDAAGRLTGRLPLCLMRSPLTGRRLVSLPFTDHAPLQAEDTASAAELIERATRLAREERVRYLELRTGPHAALATHSDFAASDLYVRWIAELEAGADAAWSRIKKPVQTQIKKARKLGVQVRRATERADMLAYYRLHLGTRTRKHGMPAQPVRYFLELWDTLAASGQAQVFLAEHEGQTIAGLVLLASGREAHYAYGASDERFLQLAPNNLLMWEAMVWACGAGYATFDFGRTARDNAGLMQFKRGWGTTMEPLTYYYSPRVAGLAATSEESRAYRLLTSGWRRLPLAVAGPLGGALYRHLG